MKKFIAVGIGLLAASCVNNRPPFPSHTLSSADVVEVQRAVRARLVDPNSARFGAIRAHRSGSGTIGVCGRVDSIDEFGKRTGMQVFIGNLEPSRFRVITVGSQEIIAEGPEYICKTFGSPV